MKRALVSIGLLVCTLAGFGVVSAAYPVPDERWNVGTLERWNVTDPHFYGGKISALKKPFEQARPVHQRSNVSTFQRFNALDLPTFGTDVNIAGGNEVTIAANPTNPLNFVAGANTTGRFTTTDGGVTWNVGNLSGGGDPVAAFDAAGNAYFALLGNTSSCPDLPLLYKSTNGGLNWGSSTFPFTEPNPTINFYDKEWLNVDNWPASPYFGRIYYTVSVFRTPPGCNLNQYIDVTLKLTYSTDQGVTWSPASVLNDASHNQNQFTHPVPAPDGTLYVGYQYQNCTFNCTRDIPMVNLIAKSTDGGVTFSPSITITNQPISPTGAYVGGYQYLYASTTSNGFRHNDQAVLGVSPTDSNTIYALWTDGRWETTFVYQGVTGSHGDILFSRSTDGGNTWTAPLRVNDDPQGNGKDQFFPWMAVGNDGVLHASWMDRRDSTGFLYREYYSQSTDGGLTWAANIQVSDVGGTPSTFIGDYSSIAVNANNTLVLPLWTDSRAGTRVYTDRGVISGAATPTPTPTPTITSTPTVTRGTSPSGGTPTPPRGTPTPSRVLTSTATPTVMVTFTSTHTGTPMPTFTNTPTFTYTSTTTLTPTPLVTVPPPTLTYTPASTDTPTVTSTPCNINFSDVTPSDYFYVPVTYLACHNVISGYADGTFLPYNNTTRAQMCKIIVLAEGWTIDTTGGPHFSDVPATDPFYDFVETAYNHSIISGYGDGTFRPGNNVTRGQTCKIVVLAEEWELFCPPKPTFNDVPPTHPFYCFIETAVLNGPIISGYADGTFRPGNDVTRGQLCKIVYLAITQP